MFIQQMQAIVYPSDESRSVTETTEHPSWEAVERAIRRLDRDRYPFIWLYRDADASHTDIPDFTIMGGLGAYIFGPEDTFFYDESHSGEMVNVWLSDQGASFPDWQVCHDLEIVVRATRLFAETGQLDRNLTWKTVQQR